MSKNINITVNNSAIVYLKNLIKLEDDNNLIIYLSVLYPQTEYAHVNVTYCKQSDIEIHDIRLNIHDLNIYIDKQSSQLLHDSIIDFKNDELVINAPHIYKKKSLNIEEKIKSLFEKEINVMLSQHGGFIELVKLENNNTITIKFHGGCQGCGMVGYTLNNYIEKIIKKHFPDIKHINDITSHNVKDNSYY